jgi:hypothetical protein
MRRLMISVALVAALVACKKEEKKADPAPAPVAGTAAATGAAPATGAGPATGAADPVVADPAAPAPAGDRPASVTPEMVAVAEKMIGAMEAMGKDLTAAGTDCAKGAAALKDHAAKLQPIAVEAKKFENKDDKEAEAWFQANYMPRMMGAMGGMMSLAQACQADADFAAAMKEMSDLDM